MPGLLLQPDRDFCRPEGYLDIREDDRLVIVLRERLNTEEEHHVIQRLFSRNV